MHIDNSRCCFSHAVFFFVFLPGKCMHRSAGFLCCSGVTLPLPLALSLIRGSFCSSARCKTVVADHLGVCLARHLFNFHPWVKLVIYCCKYCFLYRHGFMVDEFMFLAKKIVIPLLATCCSRSTPRQSSSSATWYAQNGR